MEVYFFSTRLNGHPENVAPSLKRRVKRATNLLKQIAFEANQHNQSCNNQSDNRALNSAGCESETCAWSYSKSQRRSGHRGIMFHLNTEATAKEIDHLKLEQFQGEPFGHSGL
ncbi:unnamed protein product [Protopolystoma xenopodis]|uniref:Uncharacterized protein n=1 Tax=Protopolystoma xenopodis TaxID=117903 RepID=A0A3S5FE86_9PLAT|nr:unnamed protein product [Protopolystoma xenopodis]